MGGMTSGTQKNEPNSWVQFDFKARRACLTSCSLKSDGDNRDHLVQWVIEGSNDGTEWKAVDSRSTQDLNGNYIVKTYECDKGNKAFYHYLRLHQTGKNSTNRHFLQLSEIEFFGFLQ